jgi:hypothetical protein
LASRPASILGASERRFSVHTAKLITRTPHKHGRCRDQLVAQSEPEPQDSQLRDALLDAVSGALRILGGMVQMAAGVTRVVAVAVLKAAAAAEKAVEASEEDGEKSEQKPMPHPRSKRLGERKSS